MTRFKTGWVMKTSEHRYNKWVSLSCLALILLLVSSGSSFSKEVPLNLMIDFESSGSSTASQLDQEFNSMINMTNVIDPKSLNFTIFASGDTIAVQRLALTSLGKNPNHEIALNGKSKDENLSTMPYSKQLDLLTVAQKNINSCHICGGKIVLARSFRPQSFNQNNDTFKVLEGLGFLYDAGFKAGILYQPGHKNDVWPYLIQGYNLYAVPVSTYNLSGERVYLSDRYAKEEKGLSGSKWYDLLAGKFDEASLNGDPMVVIFSNSVSGSGDYLDGYKNFINYAVSKNAKFVTTMELVNVTLARNGTGKLVSLPVSSVCPTCGQNEKSSGLAIGVNITHQGNTSRGNCTDCNKSSSNVAKA